MGDRNADRRGGLEGKKAEKMIQIPAVVTRKDCCVRADIMRWQGDESCARHLELAAEEIRVKVTASTTAEKSARGPGATGA